MRGAVCRSMMCGLPREDFRECERLMSVPVTAAASSLPLQPPVADGAGRLDAWRAGTRVWLGADIERLVGELVRGDLG
jgi:hypothetical protein